MPEKNQRPGRDLKFYGRKKGVRLSARQQKLVETALPALRPDVENPFPDRQKAYWLEIGFGGGEHIALQAANNLNVELIGAEPFVNGVAKLLVAINDKQITNIKIHDGDARVLLENTPDQCLEKVFLLYPDPWHKQRHQKRRFVNKTSIGHFQRILKPGGKFVFASDIADYVNWTVQNIEENGGFSWNGQSLDDWRTPPDDWQKTRYEAKALRQGRTPAYITFTRI